jgi:hypothetical protein
VYIVKEGEFRVTLSYWVKGPSYAELKPMEVFENPKEAKR